jgi:hypothetical protein
MQRSPNTATAGAVCPQYAVETECRDEIKARLLERCLQTLVHYPMGIHKQKRLQRPGRASTH